LFIIEDKTQVALEKCGFAEPRKCGKLRQLVTSLFAEVVDQENGIFPETFVETKRRY
jgi:hypothetical protein